MLPYTLCQRSAVAEVAEPRAVETRADSEPRRRIERANPIPERLSAGPRLEIAKLDFSRHWNVAYKLLIPMRGICVGDLPSSGSADGRRLGPIGASAPEAKPRRPGIKVNEGYVTTRSRAGSDRAGGGGPA